MILELSGDELLLVIIGLVRKINPAMLKAEGDGFSVDFSADGWEREVFDRRRTVDQIADGCRGGKRVTRT